MALSDSPVKSIALLVGIALVGAIFIVATATLRNQQAKPVTITAKPYAEPTSGIVFDAPAEWSVGIGSGNVLAVRGVRIDDVPTQRGSCANFSRSGSATLQQAVLDEQSEAPAEWLKQLPGLVGIQQLTSSGGKVALIGIDTCAQSLNQRLLTLRGQTYQNDVEVRFSSELALPQTFSQAQVVAQAQALVAGTATTHQAAYTQFVELMHSLR